MGTVVRSSGGGRDADMGIPITGIRDHPPASLWITGNV